MNKLGSGKAGRTAAITGSAVVASGCERKGVDESGSKVGVSIEKDGG